MRPFLKKYIDAFNAIINGDSYEETLPPIPSDISDKEEETLIGCLGTLVDYLDSIEGLT